MVNLFKTKNLDNGPFSDIPEEIYAEIGCRLILIQNLELLISWVTKVVFEKDPIRAKKNILNAEKKTMGQMIKALRKKVSINDDFEMVLYRTLSARNLFVHEFSNKYNLRSKDELINAIKFLNQTLGDLEEVTNVMKAVIIVFAKEQGIDDPNIKENWRKYGDLDILEKKHLPKIANIFKII